MDGSERLMRKVVSDCYSCYKLGLSQLTSAAGEGQGDPKTPRGHCELGNRYLLKNEERKSGLG